MKRIKNTLNTIFSLFGFTIIKKTSVKKLNLEILKEPIIEDEFKYHIKKIEDIFGKGYSAQSLYSVYSLCRYIYENKIDGDLIECGVYEGASFAMMIIYFQKKTIFKNISL